MASEPLLTIFSFYRQTAKPTHTRAWALLFMNHDFQNFQLSNQLNTILQGCRLFQQYLVHQFCRVESEHLQNVQQSQVALRAADYKSSCKQLRDLENTKNEVDAVQTGRLFVLQSVCVGGDQYMRLRYQFLTRSVIQNFFLAITCNLQ